jgi:hypothetical protein
MIVDLRGGDKSAGSAEKRGGFSWSAVRKVLRAIEKISIALALQT